MNIFKKRIFAIVVICVGLNTASATNDETPVDEIIVYGTPVAGVYGALSLHDMADDWADQISDVLGNTDSLLEELSEAQCDAQIESWRQDCHTQMGIANVGCTIAGGYLMAPIYRLLFEDLIADAVRPFGGAGAGMACNDWYQLSLQYCDLIAASSRAPTIAMCVGSGSG